MGEFILQLCRLIQHMSFYSSYGFDGLGVSVLIAIADRGGCIVISLRLTTTLNQFKFISMLNSNQQGFSID